MVLRGITTTRVIASPFLIDQANPIQLTKHFKTRVARCFEFLIIKFDPGILEWNFVGVRVPSRPPPAQLPPGRQFVNELMNERVA